MSENDLIVSADWLSQNLNNVKIIDASQTLASAKEFNVERDFGNFEELIKRFTNTDYLNEHIPGAAHFNFDVGYYPSKWIKFDLYPPEIIQKYIRLLGVNNGDHVVVYGRGAGSGMMWASRLFWTFRAYGYENVSILDGGLEAWKSRGGAVKSGYERFDLGDFVAGNDTNVITSFEQIPFNNFGEQRVEYLDARTAAQFSGEEPLSSAFPGTTANGSHVSAAKNLPMASVIGPNGFKTKTEIDQIITSLNLKADHQVIVACNTGIQASVLFTVLARSGLAVKVYNGSMFELAYRAPELVNTTGNQIFIYKF